MALVGSISGSGGASSTIGVSGSVIFANRTGGSFPGLPGSDAVFFVSGNIAARSPGSPAATPDYTVRGTSVFGGDVVISGTLFGGSPLYIGDQIIARNGLVVTGTIQSTAGLSGSLTKLADGTSYLIAGTNVTIVTGANGAVTISSTAAGGGGGGFFTESANKVIYNSGSVAFTGDRTGETITAASGKGVDVQFYFSGSNAGGNNNRLALFGGGLVSSGTIKVTDGTNAATITAQGVISGASDLQAGGNLTVAGTSTLVGNVTVTGDVAVNGGDITTTATTFNLVNANATTVALAGAGTDISIGATSGNAYLKNATTNVSGTLTVAGAINANNGTIATSQTTFNLANTTATTVNIGGAATTVSVGAGTGTTTVNNNLTVSKNLVVTGDLYISGTTTTIDSTVVEIQDPIIGLGFASGSVAAAAGDRGFIGGITGAGNNVAFVWSNTNGAFIAAKTATGPGSAPMVVGQHQPIRASKFELGGTTAFITSSNGTTLAAQGNVININANTGGTVDFQVNSVSYINFNDGGGGNARFGAVSGKQLVLSGSTVNFNASTPGFVFQREGVPIGIVSGTTGAGAGLRIAAGDTAIVQELTLSGSTVIIGANGGTTTVKGGTVVGDQTTQNLFNTVATTLNIGGAASVNIGSSGGTTTLAGALQVNGNTTFGNDINSDLVSFANAKVSTAILPNGDKTLDLGSATARWANIYTGDLHLRNERGDYTLIEEPDALTIRYNKTGKRYRILVERAPEYDG